MKTDTCTGLRAVTDTDRHIKHPLPFLLKLEKGKNRD